MILIFIFDIFFYNNSENFKNNDRNITLLIGVKHNAFLNLILSLLSGYFEELLFRGYFFLLLSLLIPNIYINILIVSITFGFLHITQKKSGVILTTIISIIFFISIIISKTILYAMIFHALFNFVELSIIYPYQKRKIINRIVEL